MPTRPSRPAAAFVVAALLLLGGACDGAGDDDTAEPPTGDGGAGAGPSSIGTMDTPAGGGSEPPVTGGMPTGADEADGGGAWPIDPTLVGVVRASTERRFPEVMATVDDAALTAAIATACGHARAAVATQSSVEEAAAAILADLPSDPVVPDLRAAMRHAVHRFFLAGGCGDELSPLTAVLLDAP